MYSYQCFGDTNSIRPQSFPITFLHSIPGSRHLGLLGIRDCTKLGNYRPGPPKIRILAYLTAEIWCYSCNSDTGGARSDIDRVWRYLGLKLLSCSNLRYHKHLSLSVTVIDRRPSFLGSVKQTRAPRSPGNANNPKIGIAISIRYTHACFWKPSFADMN